MESNGKTVSLQGKRLNFATSPIVWGGMGNQAQHAYYQLLCQGAHTTPCDIIMVKSEKYQRLNEHANRVIKTLQQGASHQDQPSFELKSQVPLSTISIEEINPYTLGALISLFEHKVYVQSVMWNINPFDQPGVEVAKRR